MKESPAAAACPLRWATPARWVESVLERPLALLNDHAHLERKAASNALELISRWPFPVHAEGSEPVGGADRWSQLLASIARDEVSHLTQVLRLLTVRGGHFERSHANPYAHALRAEVRRGQALRETLDRLLVSALIEARSGERFRLLAAHAPDPVLARFYASLVASEDGHTLVFVELARMLPQVEDEVDPRFDALLDYEATVMASLPAAPSMHSGVPVS